MKITDTLFYGADGVWSGGIAHILIILSLVIAAGRFLGSIRIFGISFGVTWVLFLGIIFGHFGLTIDINLLHFLKEFGLVLFVYSIGIQVGPGFFSSFRSGGLGLNALAVIVIFAGVAITLLLFRLTGIPITTMTGIMSGAVTNTPGLGAAQQAFSDMTGHSAPDIALGYAVAYPLGVIGCILSFIIIRKAFYRQFSSTKSAIFADNKNVSTDNKSVKRFEHPNIIPIFIGISLGCFIGSIPIAFPGIPQPVKLGLAGGPLIVSILISYLCSKLKIHLCMTISANLMIRELGISLFLACVGLEAGAHFVDTLVDGRGYVWIAYGAAITVIPVLLGGLIGRYVLKIDYNTLTGVLSGACTNPPALAYASEQDEDSENADVGYATVYPLAMVLRLLAAQILILIFIEM